MGYAVSQSDRTECLSCLVTLSLVKIAKNLKKRAARSARWWGEKTGSLGDVPSAGTCTASAGPPSRRPGRSSTPLHLVFRGRGRAYEQSVSGARGFADDRERIYRERRLGCRRGGRGGWIGSSGRLGEGSRALAARPTRRGYDVPPGSATRASDLVRRGSVPDTIAPYRLAWKGARSNGVRANSRCDAGRRASPGSARVRRARRGVGHASVRVDAGDTRETRERRRAVREGRARVWVCAYDHVTRHFIMCTPEISNALYRVFKTDDPYAGGIRRTRSRA